MEHSAACASQPPGDRLIELIYAESVRALAAQERELCVTRANRNHLVLLRGVHRMSFRGITGTSDTRI
jgi:hypothetical protein